MLRTLLIVLVAVLCVVIVGTPWSTLASNQIHAETGGSPELITRQSVPSEPGALAFHAGDPGPELVQQAGAATTIYLPDVSHAHMPVIAPTLALAAHDEHLYFGSGSHLFVARRTASGVLVPLGVSDRVVIDADGAQFDCRPDVIALGQMVEDRPFRQHAYAICRQPLGKMWNPDTRSALVSFVHQAGNPVLTSALPFQGRAAAMAVHGDWAYVATEDRLLAFDLTEPDRPVSSGSNKLDMVAQTMVADGDTLLIGGSQGDFNSVHRFDISRNDKPILVASKEWDIYGSFVTSMVRQGDLLYTIQPSDKHLVDVFDLSAPASITHVGSISVLSLNVQVANLQAAQGRILLTAVDRSDDLSGSDEIVGFYVLEPFGDDDEGIADARVVGRLKLDGDRTIQEGFFVTAVSQDTAYLTRCDRGGVLAVNIANLRNPRLVGKLVPTRSAATPR